MRLAGPYSKKLTIFEGPDGSGKSTAAQHLAWKTHAHYVHCGPFLTLNEPADLARMYVEAMMPAVLGHRDVVMDRCWLSELPYGQAHRGKVRLRATDLAMLERLALRCATVLAVARPPFEQVKETWESRKGRELLTTDVQVKAVYDWYHQRLAAQTALPWVSYNYLSDHLMAAALDYRRTPSHPVAFKSCGHLAGRVVVVGEAFGRLKPGDPGYQWCFASFSRTGCSQWLAQQLLDASVPEQELVWINADQPESHVKALIEAYPRQQLMALGQAAATLLAPRPGVLVEVHPQFHKRFKSGEPYGLVTTLKEILQ